MEARPPACRHHGVTPRDGLIIGLDTPFRRRVAQLERDGEVPPGRVDQKALARSTSVTGMATSSIFQSMPPG